MGYSTSVLTIGEWFTHETTNRAQAPRCWSRLNLRTDGRHKCIGHGPENLKDVEFKYRVTENGLKEAEPDNEFKSLILQVSGKKLTFPYASGNTMSFTRRDILLVSSTLPLASGCTKFKDKSSEIVRLKIILANGQSEELTYRYALETTEGRRDWSSYQIKPETKKEVVVNPSKSHKIVAVHGSVAGYEMRQELLKYDSENICPNIYIEYDWADRPTILQDTNTSCK